MHDPMVVAFEVPRPWPRRTGLAATGEAGVRWCVRRAHKHWASGGDSCGCKRNRHGEQANPFPWWKPGSYKRFWRLAGRDFYWPPIITVWHVEPGGRDSLTVCSRKYQRPDGTWGRTRGWRWHVWHWHLQFPPLQQARRWLLTRCEGCGGKSRKGNPVYVSYSWDGPRGHWWQGEPGLHHAGCGRVPR